MSAPHARNLVQSVQLGLNRCAGRATGKGKSLPQKFIGTLSLPPSSRFTVSESVSTERLGAPLRSA
eukprot:8349947-Alexandrium_andersonii.AAC.1